MWRMLIPPAVREDLPTYTRGAFIADLRAGLTVAIFAAPQGVAYALLAGVPPVHGLYAGMVMSIIAALWGSSRYVNTGSTNSAALLAAVALTPWFGTDELLPVCFALTLMVGLIRLAMGLLRLGRLLQWVPESGFLGFTVGAGLLIAVGQLHHLIHVSPGDSRWPPARMWETLRQSADTNIYTLGIGLGCLALLLAADRTRLRNSAALAVLVLASLVPPLVGDAATIPLVRDIVPISHGLPEFALPSFDPAVWRALLPSALAISVVGLIEAVSIGKSLALKRGERMDFDQEFVGQGLSHVVSAFFQGMPGSGSFSRSGLMEYVGTATRFANVYFGVFTALALLLFPKLLDRIPVSALAGLLLFIGYKLVNVTRIRRVWATSQPDLALMIATFFVTVFVRIEYGIFVGVVLGALIFLNRACEVRLSELTPADEEGRYDETPYERGTAHPPSDLVALSLAGDLFYGQADMLRDRLDEILRTQRPRAVIIRMRRAHSVDYSCWSVLLDFAEALARRGGALHLTGVNPALGKIIGKEAVQRLIPANRVYARTETPFESFETCLRDVLKTLPADAAVSPAWRRVTV